MPRGDNTGPNGQGPRTGRGLGYCNGYESPGYTKDNGFQRGGRGYGRNAGQGRGMGYRRRGNFNDFASQDFGVREVAPVLPEKTVIENELNYLKAQVDMLSKRLSEINKTPEN